MNRDLRDFIAIIFIVIVVFIFFIFTMGCTPKKHIRHGQLSYHSTDSVDIAFVKQSQLELNLLNQIK